MKTSRAKSFRLHHLNKTNSLRKTSQSFLDPDESFKLAALNSVTRGIRKVDLSVITGDDLCKLRVEPLQPKEGQQTSAHCSLMDVRIRYDEMKKKCDQTQNHISKQKQQIGKLQTIKKEYENRKDIGISKVASFEQKLKSIKDLLDETHTEVKVLQSMRVRHHADKVVYDQRKYDLEQWLIYQRKQLDIYRREEISSGENIERSAKVYEKLQEEIAGEYKQREVHIKNLENMIEEKLVLVNANQMRQAELGEIASRAIQDKGQDEKHWRMVYLTHLFVNRMLRYKIEVEMQKFKIVEQAFKTIKTATGVSDAKTLITKYLSKQIVYGQLLGKIADNERIINDLKAEGEKLVGESKALEAEREVLQSIKIKSQDLHDCIKQFEGEDEKAVIAYGFTRKMKQWAHRQLKKLTTVTGAAQQEPEQLTEVIKVFLGNLSSIVDSVEGEILFREQGDAGHPEKIVRVMPKRSRKNSMGEQIFDVDEQDVNPGVHHEETEFVNNQYDQLIHTNQRFMRELKRKFEEERKVNVQRREVKAKSPVKVAQQKKEED